MINLGTNYTFVKFEGHGSSEALSLLTNKPVEVDMVLGDIMITKVSSLTNSKKKAYPHSVSNSTQPFLIMAFFGRKDSSW